MPASRAFDVSTIVNQHVTCNNASGDTLLHWALRKHAISLVRRLVQHGLPTNLPNDEGQTPLHLAVSSKDLAACKLLVGASASLHAEDKHGKSPVDLAMTELLDGDSADDAILDFLVQHETVSREHEAELFRAFCSAISTNKSILIDVFLRQGRSFLDRDPKTGGTTLHFAIVNTKSLATLRRLIEAGVDVNAVDRGGATALHAAAQRCNTKFVRYLIAHGATVDAIDSDVGGTPLAGAIFGAKTDNARALVEAGANVSHKLKPGRPLLHLAAQQGQRGILELILLAGVPVSIFDELGETAAYWACQNGHLECIESLITHGLNLALGKTNLMEAAIKKGHIPIVECLWKHGLPITKPCLQFFHGLTDVESSRWEMLDFILRHLKLGRDEEGAAGDKSFEAISNPASYLSFGFVTLAAAYLEAGRKVGHLDDKASARLLFSCAAHGFLSGTRALLNSAVSLDKVRKYYFEPHGWGALEIAVCENRTEVIKLLLEHGWDPNREDVLGRTSLHLAALCGATDVIKELLDECDVHHRDRERNTPVHLGARSGSTQVLELLVGAGGDLNKRNKSEETPLGIACENGHAEVVRWLLGQGSRSSTGDASHLQPLHHSAGHNHVDCMDLLIASGSDVNAECPGANTPLHIAAMSGAWKAISRLLDADADVNCSNHQGMTPLAMALLQAEQCPDTTAALLNKTSVDWDARLSQNIVFTSCTGGNKDAIAAVFARLKQERPKTAKKTVRRLLPELLAGLCTAGPAANSAAFPFLLEYMHSSSKEVLSTTILVEAIRAGDDADLAQALVDIDEKNAYLRMPNFWTMLHVACRYGRIKIARVLLANGSPTEAENEEGLTPSGTAKKYLAGDKFKEFENLFRVYETTTALLRKDEGVLDQVVAAEMGIPWHVFDDDVDNDDMYDTFDEDEEEEQEEEDGEEVEEEDGEEEE